MDIEALAYTKAKKLTIITYALNIKGNYSVLISIGIYQSRALIELCFGFDFADRRTNSSIIYGCSC